MFGVKAGNTVWVNWSDRLYGLNSRFRRVRCVLWPVVLMCNKSGKFSFSAVTENFARFVTISVASQAARQI